MSTDTNDSLKTSIAELLGKKPSELKPEINGNLYRNWHDYLAEQGVTLKFHRAGDDVHGRHIVMYSDVRGDTQAVLSDAEAASKVEPISRLSISEAAPAKAAKTKVVNVGDQKDA